MPLQMNRPIMIKIGATMTATTKPAAEPASIGPIWWRSSDGRRVIRVDWKARLHSWPTIAITQPTITANRSGLKKSPFSRTRR